jgi:hypothetical protein
MQMRPRKSEAGFANVYPPSQADFLFPGMCSLSRVAPRVVLALVPLGMGAFCFLA